MLRCTHRYKIRCCGKLALFVPKNINEGVWNGEAWCFRHAPKDAIRIEARIHGGRT